MWGRKKKAEAAAQASIAAVAPVSYWATHADPDASRAPGLAGRDRSAPAGQLAQSPRDSPVRTTITFNGRQIDPASPEGRQVLAVASGEQAYAVSPAGQDGTDQFYMFAGPGGQERLKELLPFIDKHRRHKITDAEFEAAQRRILGGTGTPNVLWGHEKPGASLPGASLPVVELPLSAQDPIVAAQLLREPSAGDTLRYDGRQIDPGSPEGRRLMGQVSAGGPTYLMGVEGADGVRNMYLFPRPDAKEHVGELMPLIERHLRREITDAEFEAAQRRILDSG